MKNIFGWILAAAGAYIIYEKFIVPNQVVGGGTTTQPGTTPTQNATNPTTSVVTNTTSPATVSVAPYAGTYGGNSMQLIQQFQSYVSQHGVDTTQPMNTDQWNWYFNQATGANGPAPETMGISPRDSVMSFASYNNMMGRWLNNVTSLQGIPGFNGIGRLVPVNYMGQHPTGRDYRSMGRSHPSATPTGWELTTKQVS